jgi:hypothetical protein
MIKKPLGKFNMFDLLRSQKYFFYIVLLILFILSEYFFLGDSSYSRTGDHLDTFMPRFWSFYENNYSNWIGAIQMGIDSHSAGLRHLYFPAYLFPLFGFKFFTFAVLFLGFCSSSYFIFKILTILKFEEKFIFVGLAFYLVMMHRLDLMWYIIGISVVPISAYYFNKSTNSSTYLSVFYFAIGALIYFLNSSFLLSLIYTYPILIGILYLMHSAENNNLRRFFMLSFLITFFAVIFYLPSLILFAEHASQTDRGNILYYNYGLFGTIALLKPLLFEYWLVLILGLTGIWLAPIKLRKTLIQIVLSIIIIILLQAYGWLLPILDQFFGKLSNIPLQRYSIVLPFLSLILITYSLQYIDTRHFVVINDKKYTISSLLSLIILFQAGYLHLDRKVDHLHQWSKYGNYGWIKSPDWELLPSDKSSYRIAIIASSEKSFVPGIAQLLGFQTLGGDETTTSHYIDYWKALNIGPQPTPKHSFYLGYGWEDDFKNKPVESIIDMDLLGMANVHYIVSTFRLYGKQIQPIFEPDVIENTKDLREKLNQKLDHIINGGRLFIYKLNEAKPRFSISSEIIYSDEDSFQENLRKLGIKDSKVIISEQFKDELDLLVPGQIESINDHNITIISQHADEIILNVEVNQPCLLIIANSYNQNWRASVNAEDVPVYPVNYNFQGIPLTQGVNEVILKYQSVPNRLYRLIDMDRNEKS